MSVTQTLLGLFIALVLLWAALLVTLAITRPRGARLGEAIRLLPDTLRLLTRLSKDTSLPRRVRVRTVLLLAYLASPIDLVPDFIPVVGYADDAIISYIVLRSVVRAAGPDVVTNHWPGSPEGLTALRRLLGTEEPAAGE
jgi:uncharacterized membrane protein YkvA (DUF1232 family)